VAEKFAQFVVDHSRYVISNVPYDTDVAAECSITPHAPPPPLSAALALIAA
jgi:hypothetical protein